MHMFHVQMLVPVSGASGEGVESERCEDVTVSLVWTADHVATITTAMKDSVWTCSACIDISC